MNVVSADVGVAFGKLDVRKRGPKHRMIFVAGTMRGCDNYRRYDRDGFTPLLLST